MRKAGCTPQPRTPHGAGRIGSLTGKSSLCHREKPGDRRHGVEHKPESGAGLVPGAPTEADALKLANLTNARHIPLKIDRHLFGFVIYK